MESHFDITALYAQQTKEFIRAIFKEEYAALQTDTGQDDIVAAQATQSLFEATDNDTSTDAASGDKREKRQNAQIHDPTVCAVVAQLHHYDVQSFRDKLSVAQVTEKFYALDSERIRLALAAGRALQGRTTVPLSIMATSSYLIHDPAMSLERLASADTFDQLVSAAPNADEPKIVSQIRRYLDECNRKTERTGKWRTQLTSAYVKAFNLFVSKTLIDYFYLQENEWYLQPTLG